MANREERLHLKHLATLSSLQLKGKSSMRRADSASSSAEKHRYPAVLMLKQHVCQPALKQTRSSPPSDLPADANHASLATLFTGQ